MNANELVSALRFAGTCLEAAECITRFRPRADPAEITGLLDSAARYIEQARAQPPERKGGPEPRRRGANQGP